MRFLVDASLSPTVVRVLRAAGHDALQVGEALRLDAPDDEIFNYAAEDDRVIVAADTDFGDLAAFRRTTKPSLVLFRRPSGRRPFVQANVLLATLPDVEDDLTTGAIVVIEERRVRVRQLPIGGPPSEGAT